MSADHANQERQRSQDPPGVQRFGSLVIDRQAHDVTLDTRPVTLTRAEYELLSILAANPGKAMSARTLLGAIWNTDWTIDVAPLHVLISRLRAKLGESGRTPRHLITVRGYGYRFDPHPGPASHRSPQASNIAAQHVQVLLSASQTMLWLSDNVHALLGVPAHQLQGRHVCSVVHPAHLDATHAAAERARSGSAIDFTWRPRAETSHTTLIDARVRPLIDATEAVRAYLVEWRSNSGNNEGHAITGSLNPIHLDP